MGKCGYRVSDVTAVWAGERWSSTDSCVDGDWRLSTHMHTLDELSSSVSSESMVYAASCWADEGTCSWTLKEERLLRVPAEAPLCPDLCVCGLRLLLLYSDRHIGQWRSFGGCSRGTVSLQEGFDGERAAELHLTSDLNSSAGCRFRRVESWAGLWWSARLLCFHFEGQLREELQDSFEVTTHHLCCDLTEVQFPVVSLAVQWIRNHWNLKTQHIGVDTFTERSQFVPLIK